MHLAAFNLIKVITLFPQLCVFQRVKKFISVIVTCTQTFYILFESASCDPCNERTESVTCPTIT